MLDLAEAILYTVRDAELFRAKPWAYTHMGGVAGMGA